MPLRIRQLTVTDADLERFWPQVAAPDENGCTLWTGITYNGEYGRFRIGRHQYVAHRVAWEAYMGDIPEGYTLDHVYAWGCRSKLCVWIGHLEPVTQAENNRRRCAVIKAKARAGLRS
ncbi:HNH endonuclease signature motif containing protein [Streptomyces sp. NPDC059709]|uniref:HNH endonuclease signature motif containing protein n=1 Tax=Streptomyces sp. NPDC059709 TaxID=3346917 RepID=UPI0036746515